MTQEQLLPLAAFILVSTVTPGPNNLMLMASGANFGIRRTLPHMCGIAFGIIVMVGLVGLGLMRVFEIWPAAELVLKLAGIAYMLWLTWKIATAAPLTLDKEAAAAGRPFGFLQAALFQWVNPKAWAIVLTAISVYAPSRDLATIAVVALAFGAISLPAIGIWTVLGQNLRRILTSRQRFRIFNGSVAALLVASLYPVITA
jgi:threonine/homoserine/homoserine lactone efflux protein